MSIFKRGRFYWYKFQFDGKEVRESTRQTNDKTARNMESAHRTRLAKERDERRAASDRMQCNAVARCPECEKLFNAEQPVIESSKHYCSERCAVEARRRGRIIPTLKEFSESRVEPWAKTTYAAAKLRTWHWQRTAIRTIAKDAELSGLPLNKVSTEALSRFCAKQIESGYSVSSINGTLRAIRKFLRLAVEWGVLESAPTIKVLAGEKQRDRVISREEERLYLAAADPDLQAFAILLFDTGIRPSEGYQLRWEHIHWATKPYGKLRILQGKTEAAKRTLALSPRLRFMLEHRWEMTGRPAEGWVWPANGNSGHYEEVTLVVRHAKALKASTVRPFVLYSTRHTFLTRLGESGCDAWTLAKIAGHSSIKISQRYVHPSEDAATSAILKLSGYKSGYSRSQEESAEANCDQASPIIAIVTSSNQLAKEATKENERL